MVVNALAIVSPTVLIAAVAVDHMVVIAIDVQCFCRERRAIRVTARLLVDYYVVASHT